ncbi:MAG: thioredoxin [Desulfobacteraceae bacterium]|nr:thioredoxin [Desulfobacteraceae bacterium]
MSENIKEIDDNGFEQDVLQSQTPVLVDFWAPWCGPCKAVAPLVDELAGEYSGKMDFAKLNIDDNPETPAKYGIKSIPTIAIFKDGKPFEMITGLTSRNKLEDAIKSVLGGASATQPFIVQ